VSDQEWVTEQFEAHRDRLRGVAYRMLGSVGEADDAVQEAWLRLHRTDAGTIDNLGGWLTTVVARVCLNQLRARSTRREDPLEAYVPDPIVTPGTGAEPEHEAVMADSVGLALLVVLETLSPAERLAFVLHDTFGVPFEEIAPLVDRTPTATRQLASRARRRVRGLAPGPDPDVGRQREVVDAFFAAAHDGDFDRLVAVLDPDVVLRSDLGGDIGASVARGAEVVAGRALMFADPERIVRPVLVNGAAGAVITRGGAVVSIMGFIVRDGRVVEIEALGDPVRIAALELELDRP
jgi:RNA polymerase sigma-70 factor (ECF subfamily)